MRPKKKAAANLETGRRRAQLKRGDARSESGSASQPGCRRSRRTKKPTPLYRPKTMMLRLIN